MMSSLLTAASVRSARQCTILTPMEGSATSAPIALNRPVCVVGDRSRVHLVLASTLVSRSHALLVDDSDGLYVRDLCSSNGVLVNDQNVLETIIHDEDTLRIGPFVFRCRVPQPTASEDEPLPLAEVHGDELGPISLNGRRTTVIGSRRGCDVRLEGIGVSPVHAVIFCRRGRWFIRDLSSEGGTRIFGRLIREAELLGGEQIRIGAAAVSYVRLDQQQPQDDTNLDEQNLTASLLDGMQAIEIGPEESAFAELPTIGENWSRQEGFDAPQVTAADLGLDLAPPNSALASASNLQSIDPEQTLMDASRSLLTLEDLIDMPTTADDLGLGELPAEQNGDMERRSVWRSLDDEPPADAAPTRPERRMNGGNGRRSRPEFEHELIGNPEESGALPQPWALLGIDSALASMGLSGNETSTRRGLQPVAHPDRMVVPDPLAVAVPQHQAADPLAAVTLRQLTFAPLVAGWAKCPGCGTAFALTSTPS